jgi:hypothetical protein
MCVYGAHEAFPVGVRVACATVNNESPFGVVQLLELSMSNSAVFGRAMTAFGS